MGTAMRYPKTRTVDAIEDVAGLNLADPYRWLEEDTAEVREWQREQARIAAEHVRRWPGFPAVRELVERFSPAKQPDVPRFAAGRWFRADTAPGRPPRIRVAAEPFGDGRVVVDVAHLDVPAGRPVLSWLSPSPDGSVLAFGICTDGSEQNTIWLADVADGTVRTDAPPQLLHDGELGGVTWLPDSSGFFYVALTDAVREYRQAVFRHRLGSPPPVEPEPVPLPETTQPTLVQVSPDGRWAVATFGTQEPRPVAIRDLHAGAHTGAHADDHAGDRRGTGDGGPWRPFVTSVDGSVAGHVVGDRYVAVTDVGAPRGRLVAIPLDAADPNDVSAWDELVPESDAVLRTVTPVGDLLYLIEQVDTYSRVRTFDRSGRAVGAGKVPLPASAVLDNQLFRLMALVPSGHPDEFVFSCSTLVTSQAVYRHRPGAAEIELLRAPAVSLEDAVVEDRWATSPDGTRIPYHVVRPASLDPARPAPTLIYAYGGFSLPFPPAFPGAKAAFVAAGGVFVHAHLRGGSEFGREWREAGRYENKQNCYDDLYAVAEDLIANGITRPDLLGVTGQSNGGLMTGVAVTQRPDLWRVAVPVVPMLDLVGGLRSPYTVESTRMDRGDPGNPADVRRLATYSPYAQVKEGTDYPAVFVTAGATDPRCPPWHARKWVARLQAAQTAQTEQQAQTERPAQDGAAPILLHVWDDAGHGRATAGDIMLENEAEWLAFIMRHLGMRP